MWRAILITAFLAIATVAGGSCGGSNKQPGDPCDPTPAGATKCASGVCLEAVQCQNSGKTFNACAGAACGQNQPCPSAAEECVVVGGGPDAFCLPTSECT